MRLLSSSEDYTSRRFAEVIVDFMDSFHIRQANLVGTDMKAETLARIVVTTVQGQRWSRNFLKTNGWLRK